MVLNQNHAKRHTAEVIQEKKLISLINKNITTLLAEWRYKEEEELQLLLNKPLTSYYQRLIPGTAGHRVSYLCTVEVGDHGV